MRQTAVFVAVARCSHALFASRPCLLLQVKVQSHVTFLGSILFHYFSLPGSNINCRCEEKQARLAGLEPATIPLFKSTQSLLELDTMFSCHLI